jgi:hypothetical protein
VGDGGGSGGGANKDGSEFFGQNEAEVDPRGKRAPALVKTLREIIELARHD